MKTIKEILIITSLLYYPFFSAAQSYVEVLKALNLPIYKMNDKPIDENMLSNSNWDNSFSIEGSLNNEMFSKVYLKYDELRELNSITFYFASKKKFNKNKEEILSIIRNFYGSEQNIKSENDGIHYVFVKDKSELELFDAYSSYVESTINVKALDNIKTVEKYDEFNKWTRIIPINFRQWVSQGDLEYGISFIGYKESKILFIKITSESKEWKFFESIQILLDNGEVISKNLKTSKDVVDYGMLGVITQEIGVADFSKEEADNLLKSRIIKMRINGKRTGDIILTDDVINALKAVYNILY